MEKTSVTKPSSACVPGLTSIGLRSITSAPARTDDEIARTEHAVVEAEIPERVVAGVAVELVGAAPADQDVVTSESRR